MRSFATFGVLSRKPKYTGSCKPACGHAETLKNLLGLERLENLEKKGPIPALLEFKTAKAIWQEACNDARRCGIRVEERGEADE